MNIIGMMSGTSVDSIDCALCEIAQRRRRIVVRMVAFDEFPIEPQLRSRIFRLFENGPGSLELACSLNFEIGRAFAAAANRFIEKHGIARESVDAIASHGQTAYHIPPHMATPESGLCASTIQIGEPAVIARETGVRVVADFRVADMAAGGNGAPLVPFADFHLFSKLGETIVVQNIGGIANCTVLPSSDRLQDVVAFDTGPGNMIIDGFTQLYFSHPFDRDGAIGRTGTIRLPLLEEWMSNPYIQSDPPKTTGRELFGLQFVRAAAQADNDLSPEDLVATATAFTARSIVESLARLTSKPQISQILLAGGGARNSFLVELIRRDAAELLPACRVELLESTGFDGKSRECVAFAMLGFARLMGMPGNVPSATGASAQALLGNVVEPAGPRA